MIRIGDFARLGQVSVATLRHYDEIGLLRPARIDDSSGYRLYEVGQLSALNRILALKDLGFSLPQIGEVLGGVSVEQLRGMLALKHAELARTLADETARLKRIAARITELELEETMPDYEVVLKNIPSQRIASRRVTIPTNDQVPEYLGAAFTEVYGLIRSARASEAGPCLAIWHQGADVFEQEDAEAAVPVGSSVQGNDRVQVYTLESGPVASVVHRGPLGGMIRAHAALLSWIEANGHEANGTYREVYLQEQTDSTEGVTEIQYPLRVSSDLKGGAARALPLDSRH